MSAAARGAAGWLYASGIFNRRRFERRIALQALHPETQDKPLQQRPVVVTYRKRRVWP